ncbi:CAP domain-containing protein [Streptomyces sp. NPDC046977]|uniref:CAP domain-containing protein n=1 Tax=Streptomyces sp. NPDC046977 TaxID=3154703 RepID=UPI0033ECD4E6
MTNHRRTTRHRKIVVAALAVAAVGVPSVAMASIDSPQHDVRHGAWSRGHWQNGHWAGQWSHGNWAGSPSSAPHAPAPPASAPAQAPGSAPSGTLNANLTSLVKLVNQERAKAGCSALTVNARLTDAAQEHSADMADTGTMSHTGSDGSTPSDRISAAGYNWRSYGENVAYGYSSPSAVMKGWMNSPGHKRNILDCSFKEIGVGLAQPGSYWTQDFGASR